jgi:hypothetical protein
MNKILIYILLTINALGLDLQLITKIPSSELLRLEQFNGNENTDSFEISHIRKDGCFLVTAFGQKSTVITDTGKYICFDSRYSSGFASTNIVSIVQNSVGESTFTIDVITKSSETNNNGLSILKTISSSGYISEYNVSITEMTFRYTVNNNGTKQEYLSGSTDKFNIFTKFDSQWKPVSSLKTYGLTSNRKSNMPGQSETDANIKQTITYELKDGFIYFYRLTDSDLLSSPNRITVGSNQNGLLTATVKNPEQALLNIQSSTNLIDWNTFKTIQNEPSLEIVVPANKQKEFIRATE